MEALCRGYKRMAVHRYPLRVMQQLLDRAFQGINADTSQVIFSLSEKTV